MIVVFDKKLHLFVVSTTFSEIHIALFIKFKFMLKREQLSVLLSGRQNQHEKQNKNLWKYNLRQLIHSTCIVNNQRNLVNMAKFSLNQNNK